MQLLQHRSALSHADSAFIDDGAFYSLYADGGCLHSAMYRVVPAGRNFFHILEVPRVVVSSHQ